MVIRLKFFLILTMQSIRDCNYYKTTIRPLHDEKYRGAYSDIENARQYML